MVWGLGRKDVDGEAFERGAVFDAAAIEAVDALKRLKSTIERTIGKQACIL